MLSFSKYGVFKIEILKQQNSRIKDFFKIKALHNWRFIHPNQSLSSGWRLQTHFGAHKLTQNYFNNELILFENQNQSGGYYIYVFGVWKIPQCVQKIWKVEMYVETFN